MQCLYDASTPAQRLLPASLDFPERSWAWEPAARRGTTFFTERAWPYCTVLMKVAVVARDSQAFLNLTLKV